MMGAIITLDDTAMVIYSFVCSGHGVIFQVCEENCARPIMWSRRLSSATTSPKAQLPPIWGHVQWTKKPQGKIHELLRKEHQLCGNRKGKITTAAAGWDGFWVTYWNAGIATNVASSDLTKKGGEVWGRCQSGVPKGVLSPLMTQSVV